MILFDALKAHCLKNPNRVLITNAHKNYTNKEVDYISGQVYGYLKSHSVGREDVVMIHLPRSADIVFVFYGILKAGACAVIVDADAREMYVDYFKRDASPVLVITPEVYRTILASDYMSGYEEPNSHDAACIIYTSSSTGKPKGCVHEYGAIDWYLSHFDYDASILETSTERTALVTEFYDVATISLLLDVIYAESYVYVVPREIAHDPIRYADVIREHNLTTAILMQRFIDLDLLTTLPSLEYLALGFEIVENAYQTGVPVYNYYGMSESLLVVAYFQIDQNYDITPVGKPIEYMEVRVVDENLNALPCGEIGRIAFSNPYFRGYLNKPEETRRAKQDGLFVSEDMGYFNKQGDLVVVGRECDLIKTDEGYIVPVFVEAEIKKLFQGVSQGEQPEMEKRFQGEQIVVQAYKVNGADYEETCEESRKELREGSRQGSRQGSSEGNLLESHLESSEGNRERNCEGSHREEYHEEQREENRVVVFYLDTLEIDPAVVQEKLSRVLPSYMLPTDYVPIREVPLLTAGKLDRRALETIFRSML